MINQNTKKEEDGRQRFLLHVERFSSKAVAVEDNEVGVHIAEEDMGTSLKLNRSLEGRNSKKEIETPRLFVNFSICRTV